jgi:hypothetical protein
LRALTLSSIYFGWLTPHRAVVTDSFRSTQASAI